MDKSQSEVTNKIRSAIKKKLAEISEFVDDELPEYIMILIANQRSKAQIEKDLSLFLRNDTVNFTNWLWDLLNSLKSGTKNNISSIARTESDVSKQKEIENDEDAVVLNFDPDERETEFLSHEDTNDSIRSKSSNQATSFRQKDETRELSVEKSLSYNVATKNKEPRLLVKEFPKTLSHYPKEPLSSAVIPVKKKLSYPDDEYDPDKPEYKKSSNSVSTRKYGGPAALQANKLLLKAVDDATKSITKGKSLDDYYKPTPIKVLASKLYRYNLPRREDSPSKENSSTDIPQPKIEVPLDSTEASDLELSDYSSDTLLRDNQMHNSFATNYNRTICFSPKPHSSNPSGSSRLDVSECIEPFAIVEEFEEEVIPKSPHFIVTLDGISRTSFKRKFESDSVESMDVDEEEEDNLPADAESPEKKQKTNERCKYWPACKNSDHCLYHHPTVPCKCFPDCKFGDKCLYIHPNCKFDALCSRKDCPFTHASKRKVPLMALPVRVSMKSRKIKPVCKFYPQCTSKYCQFVHPKLCRYGTNCRSPSCLFSHFTVPSRSQLKWQAAIS